jgi:ABC-type lipoprotein release transport system permease subunit
LIFICSKFFSVINAAIADGIIVAFNALILSVVAGNGFIKKINEKIKSLHPINSQACISLVEISKNRPKIKKYIDAVANMEPSRKLVQGELDMIVKYDESYDECNACGQIYSGNV